MYKNLAGQKVLFFAWDSDAQSPKTGDAANITAKISKDCGSFAALTTPTVTELDSTNAPGVYYVSLSKAESHANIINLYAKSTTENITLEPVIIYTQTVIPTAEAIVDEWESQSQADPTGFHVNVKEVNGTSQTANDNGADINSILVDTANIDSIVGHFAYGNESLKTDMMTVQGDIATSLWNQSGIITDISELNNVSTTDLATALSNINLDYLLYQPVPDLLGEVIQAGSVLSKILSKTDDADTFTYSSDSLEAVKDTIDGLNNFDCSNDKVTVGTNEDKTGYGLANGAVTADVVSNNALDGKGDWNTVTPDAAGTAAALHDTTDALIGRSFALITTIAENNPDSVMPQAETTTFTTATGSDSLTSYIGHRVTIISTEQNERVNTPVDAEIVDYGGYYGDPSCKFTVDANFGRPFNVGDVVIVWAGDKNSAKTTDLTDIQAKTDQLDFTGTEGALKAEADLSGFSVEVDNAAIADAVMTEIEESVVGICAKFFGGKKVVQNDVDKTLKVYDEDGETLLYTFTQSANGNDITRTRTDA